jgi:hypothetical protein
MQPECELPCIQLPPPPTHTHHFQSCTFVRTTAHEIRHITLVNIQNVSANKIVDSSLVQGVETKHGLRIQFLALVVMIREVWFNA